MADRPREAYQRPNDPWSCGRAEDPCPRGPDPGGVCGAAAQCSPKLIGQRWLCRRSSVHGGPCEPGPGPDGTCGRPIIPCGPRPSLRKVRAQATICVTAAFVGIVAMLLASPRRNEFIAPGPLATQHAALLADANRCEACHAAATTGPLAWLMSIHQASNRPGAAQSALCLECHRESIDAEHALAPHGAPPAAVAELTQAMLDAGSNGRGVLHPPTSPQGELACATCHREHHGAAADLTAMTDAQCQQCHAREFTSFAHGHPEFAPGMFAGDHGVKFNHTSHAVNHFAEKQATFDCRRCHAADSAGEVQLAVGFQQACAECHAAPLQVAMADGLTLLQLPMVDSAALAKVDGAPAYWPPAAQGDFDGAIPSLMQLLLSVDNDAAGGLKRLGGDLANVDWENADDLAAAAAVAAGVRRLLDSIGADGIAALESRLVELLGPDVRPHLQPLFYRLSQVDLAVAARLWFGPQGQDPPPQAGMPRDVFFTAARRMAIPDGWLIDPAVAQLSPEQEAELARIGVSLRGELTPEAGSDPAPAPAAELPPARLPEAMVADAEARAPSNEQPRAPAQGASAAWPSDLFSELPPPRPSGWRRDDDGVRVVYFPDGHADPTIQAWLELALVVVSRQGVDSEQQARDALGVAAACVDCHRLERQGDRWTVAWSAARPASDLRRHATYFSHRPHLVQPTLADCRTCHELAPAAAPHSEANFVQLGKQTCVECHAPNAASDSCTLCHRYHWGAPASDLHPVVGAGPLAQFLSAESAQVDADDASR